MADQWPPWIVEKQLIETHPELHHYTTRAGLEGIWTSNALWATHYANLSDSSEIVILKQPLSEALAAQLRSKVIERQRQAYGIRRQVAKHGGVRKVASDLANDFVKANFAVAFEGGHALPLAVPFICSFCSHANDHPYERENGLLSQWRGYGGLGRFALVFDTRRLDALLAAEWEKHAWVTLNMKPVVYFEGPQTVEEGFPNLLTVCTSVMTRILNDQPHRDSDIFTSFSEAATLLKHRGFREEREVRVIAIPMSREALTERGREKELMGLRLMKEVHELGESKRKYVALFEQLGVKLPITRIIVGPGAHQKADFEWVQTITSGRVPIIVSETPFIG
jgi:hypothetical protein